MSDLVVCTVPGVSGALGPACQVELLSRAGCSHQGDTNDLLGCYALAASGTAQVLVAAGEAELGVGSSWPVFSGPGSKPAHDA